MNNYYLKKEDNALGNVSADEMLIALHAEEQLEMYSVAMLLYEEFEEVIKIVAKNNNFIPKYYPSITQCGGGVYIYWKDYSARNKAVHLPEAKRKRIKGKYIKINKRNGYTEKSFRDAFKKELDEIMKYETMFKVVRKKSEFLKKIDFYRNLNNKIDTTEIDEVIDYIASKLDDE
jgi:hypothetical protein